MEAEQLMASPSIVQIKASVDETDTTTQTVTTFDSAPTSGNLLILIGAIDGNSGYSSNPDGWTLIQYDTDGASNISAAVFYKISAGNETGDTETYEMGGSQRSANVLYELSGAEAPATQAPEVVANFAEGASTTPDPASFSPTGGSKDYLWIAFASMDRGDSAATGYPSGYSNTGTLGTVGTASGGATIAYASKASTAASEDPGAFTVPSTEWVSAVIAIHPGAASSIIPQAFHHYRNNSGSGL